MLWLMACAPSETITERRLWEAIVHLEDKNVLLVRMSQGNTGIFKGLTSLRLSKTNHQGNGVQNAPIEYVMRGTENDSLFSNDTVQIGSQTLSYSTEWNLRVRDSLHNIQATFSNSLPSKVALIETEGWTTDLHGLSMETTGWIQMGEYSKPLMGRALLLEHYGTKVHDKTRDMWMIEFQNGGVLLEQSDNNIDGFYSSTEDFSVPPESLLDSDTQLKWGEFTLDFGDMTPLGTIDPHAHVSTVERLVSSPFYPTPTLTIGQGIVTITGPNQDYQARYLRILRGEI